MIGVVAALLGVAGGELLIPTLILLFGADMKLAGSLSLAVSLPTMLVGFARYSRDRSFDVLGQNRRFVIGNGRRIDRGRLHRFHDRGRGDAGQPAGVGAKRDRRAALQPLRRVRRHQVPDAGGDLPAGIVQRGADAGDRDLRPAGDRVRHGPLAARHELPARPVAAPDPFPPRA